MKIKTRTKKYSEVMAIEKKAHLRPVKPNIFWRTLINVLSVFVLSTLRFKYTLKGMDKLSNKEPALFLMNHSCFNDFEIASKLLYPRAYNVIATTDGFVGMNWLMRQIGCIPTQKYITDVTLVRDITYAVRKLKSSILM